MQLLPPPPPPWGGVVDSPPPPPRGGGGLPTGGEGWWLLGVAHSCSTTVKVAEVVLRGGWRSFLLPSFPRRNNPRTKFNRCLLHSNHCDHPQAPNRLTDASPKGADSTSPRTPPSPPKGPLANS